MGLGFRVGARLPLGRRPGSLGPLGSVEGLIQNIIDATPERVGDPLHATMVGWGSVPNGVDLILHPAEEPLELRVDGEWLIASAKTSSAGPGYHAFAIEFLDRIAAESGIEWTFEDEELEFSDETGFATDRDFDALEWGMATWLAAFARRLLEIDAEEERDNGFSIALPMGFHVIGDHFAISSMGEWSRAWFERAATLDPAADPELAADWGRAFFPWWDRERDARFWLHAGLVQMWVDIPWRAPVGDVERRTIDATLACFDRVRELDPSIALPTAEIEELIAFRDGAEVAPRPHGIGFLRRLRRKPLGGGWSIEVPGYFQEELEREGTTILFHDPTRTVRVSTFSFDGSLPERPPEQEYVVDDGERWGTAGTEWIEPSEEDPHWLLTGEMRVPGGIAVTSIGFDDEKDREWAVETWRSLRAARATE